MMKADEAVFSRDDLEKIMFRIASLLLALLTPTISSAFSQPSAEDCQSAYAAMQSVERDTVPIQDFILLRIEELKTKVRFHGPVTTDAIGIKAQIESAYLVLLDLCGDTLDKIPDRLVFPSPALSIKNCSTELENLQPSFKQPLITLRDFARKIQGPGAGSTSTLDGLGYDVSIRADLIMEKYDSSFIFAYKLCHAYN